MWFYIICSPSSEIRILWPNVKKQAWFRMSSYFCIASCNTIFIIIHFAFTAKKKIYNATFHCRQLFCCLWKDPVNGSTHRHTILSDHACAVDSHAVCDAVSFSAPSSTCSWPRTAAARERLWWQPSPRDYAAENESAPAIDSIGGWKQTPRRSRRLLADSLLTMAAGRRSVRR